MYFWLKTYLLPVLGSQRCSEVPKQACNTSIPDVDCQKTPCIYNCSIYVTITTMSLITRRKIMGPRIDPCTTPHITGNTSLFTPPMLTYCVLPWRYDVNHGMLDTFTPYNRSFFINISWSIVSNAAEQSQKTVAESTHFAVFWGYPQSVV